MHRSKAEIACSSFAFDTVLGAGASQADLYRAAVAPVVEDVLSGYNGTIMAYGCTGARRRSSWLCHEWNWIESCSTSVCDRRHRGLPVQKERFCKLSTALLLDGRATAIPLQRFCSQASRLVLEAASVCAPRGAPPSNRWQCPFCTRVPNMRTVISVLRCTGAGKTYSLSSIQPNNIGMMPRAAAELFAHIGRDAGHMYTVTMSYVQIYMEMLQVCLASSLLLMAVPPVHRSKRP